SVSHPHTSLFSSLLRPPPRPTLFPYTTLFRSPETPPIFAPYAAISTTRGNWWATRALTAYSPTLASPRSNSTAASAAFPITRTRSEEHTSELQSRFDLVCRLLLEKKNTTNTTN